MLRDKMLKLALAEYDVAEIPGHMHNYKILAYAEKIGVKWYKDDETSWCGIFITFIAWQVGLLPKILPEKKALARAWMKIGVGTINPQMGDVVVLWRNSPSSWQGHVGLFIKKNKDHVWLLGGNQANRVQITRYPLERVLSFRNLDDIG